jgi:hypothetical protein
MGKEGSRPLRAPERAPGHRGSSRPHRGCRRRGGGRGQAFDFNAVIVVEKDEDVSDLGYRLIGLES